MHESIIKSRRHVGDRTRHNSLTGPHPRQETAMTPPKRHLLVCTNVRPAEGGKPSCAPRGAEAVLAGLKQAVKDAGLKDSVWVSKSGCLKHCSRGVTVMLWPEGILLADVSAADAPEIAASCGGEGRPVERLRMPDIPWE